MSFWENQRLSGRFSRLSFDGKLTFRMFKSCCRNRAERMTKKDLNYACLSEAVIQGGFLMALVVRLSVLPT